MKIRITTTVPAHWEIVTGNFNQDLFIRLNPPFPPVKLIRFDGSRPGDLVSLQLNFFLFKQIWESEITEEKTTQDFHYFIDEGKRLPFFLKYWKHKHLIWKRSDGYADIEDNIEYKGPFGLLSLLLWPVLYFQFKYRQPIYRQYFNDKRREVEYKAEE
ncbi:MAG: SRPBCC family protein [Candidatus Cyclobacteriaceae bacterium M3_2C_046]